MNQLIHKLEEGEFIVITDPITKINTLYSVAFIAGDNHFLQVVQGQDNSLLVHNLEYLKANAVYAPPMADLLYDETEDPN